VTTKGETVGQFRKESQNVSQTLNLAYIQWDNESR